MTLPVLVITGFLGAGKSSFVNRLLTESGGRRIAAIVNDFGAINIDADLIAGRDGAVLGLSNGCICCTLQGDLLRTLRLLIDRADPPDHVVIEASGIADPQGIVEALTDPVLWGAVSLDAVLAIVDAEDCSATPGRMDDPLWRAQVGGADIVALVKTTATDASPVALRLGAMGKAPILTPDGAPLPVDLILGPGGRSSPRPAHVPITADRFVTIEAENTAPASLPAFQSAIETLAPVLLRAKGLMTFAALPGRTMLFQMVGRRATLGPHDRPETGCRLVLIGERATLDPEAARLALAPVWPGVAWDRSTTWGHAAR